ncbi:hypothetical protein B0H14DRAFT_2674128 [Mycena olivaceomarginata]|nr:hypothetical protein B0H14DRAFT_2674128 [Mycena olivaceomarginata]
MYSFYYRDPWEHILSLVKDPALAAVSTWKSQHAFHVNNGHFERIIHEPYTADKWRRVDDELPKANPYTHCWLPLHLWLDKGLVTKHVKMFPIVLRALWLPSEIRNASGNGGGVLLGFMVMVKDPGNSDDPTDKQNYEFAQFKRELYQLVFEIIFEPLFIRSWNGEATTCGDGVTRVLYPGFLIESLDMEEAWCYCCCRAGRAKRPCPRCLNAPNATQRDRILVENGLHDIVHFMWNFRFSDPYQCVSYDTLHSDESGKWGHHLFPLFVDALTEHRLLSQATTIMAEFPRWRGLKHVDDFATKDFSDGQTHLDILKCILFVVVQLLGSNCSLIRCARALLQFRMMGGLRVMTKSRMQVMDQFVEKYATACKAAGNDYSKNFCFPKQHFTGHALEDIREKGVLRNATTRIGEGTHQEVAQHWKMTNFREAEKQVCNQDEDQETIARTRLIIDNFFADLAGTSPGSPEDRDEEEDIHDEGLQFKVRLGGRVPRSKLPPGSANNHWIFGSPFRHGDSGSYEDLYAQNDPVYRNFDPRLREFLSLEFPEERLSYEDELTIEIFRCVYVSYESQDDWTEAEDILRCNDNWYKRGPRHDCLIINTDEPGLLCARLRALVRCQLPSRKIVDLAVVQTMNPSNWKPRTAWDGCLVFDEEKGFSFLRMEYVVRGALLAPVRPKPSLRAQSNLHFLVDVVDGDMFLRALNANTNVCL